MKNTTIVRVGSAQAQAPRRNRPGLCGSHPSVVATQTCAALEVRCEVMTRHWRQAGKHRWSPWLTLGCRVICALGGVDAGENPPRTRDGSVRGGECRGPGVHWPPGRSQPPDRDHSNIARAYVALGKEVDEVNALMLHVARDYGFADTRSCRPIPPRKSCRLGIPTNRERGWAQRCGRALVKLKTRAVVGVAPALAQVQTILRTVKAHHLFAKGRQALRQVLTRAHRGGPVDRADPWAGARARRAVRPGDATRHHHLADDERGGQASHPTDRAVDYHRGGGQGQEPPCGGDAARALVRHKRGKEVEFGLPYLLSRLGGGYLFGTMIRGGVDESKMPLQALAGYRTIFGAHATRALLVYDRGGYATAMRALAREGVRDIGIQPKGHGAWPVAEAVRETVRSERGKTEGIIGTLKTDKYGFNKPKERLWHTLEMAGPRSVLPTT